jgi:putative transposase
MTGKTEMSRPLQVEFPGAIYHVMCRGNGRKQIFHDDGDYQRLLDGLAHTVTGTVGRYSAS